MTVRVTSVEVKEVIDTSLTELKVFIETANALINDALSVDIAAGNISTAMLTQMELWLSAHFTAIRDPQAQREKIDDTEIQYWGKAGMGLQSTPFGQQAIAIDPTGRLSNIGGKRAEVKTLDILS